MADGTSRYRRRGSCTICNFRQNVLRNGTVAMHSVYVGDERRVCPGSYRSEKYAAENAAARAAKEAQYRG